MTGEECIEIYNNLELRRYICDMARNRAKTQEDMEDYIQDAWFRVWQNGLPCQKISCYKRIAMKAIHAAYMRSWRYRRKLQGR